VYYYSIFWKSVNLCQLSSLRLILLSYHSFPLGWKRELVYRNTSESTFKKMADIYYYTPTGKKVRSNREVLEYCKYVLIEWSIKLLQNIIAFSCLDGRRWNVFSQWLGLLCIYTYIYTHTCTGKFICLLEQWIALLPQLKTQGCLILLVMQTFILVKYFSFWY
jgi:hypothetical protein